MRIIELGIGTKNRLATTVLLALLLPLLAGAGSKAYKEGTLLEGPVRAKDSSLGEGNSQVKTKNWIFVVKVGNYRYVGDVGRTGGLFNLKGKPKTDDWPVNSTIQVHFHRRMGSLYMDLKGPTGKEETAWVISKVGPDGKELCGKLKCTKTTEDDED
jgi:hypothetical protein